MSSSVNTQQYFGQRHSIPKCHKLKVGKANVKALLGAGRQEKRETKENKATLSDLVSYRSKERNITELLLKSQRERVLRKDQVWK